MPGLADSWPACWSQRFFRVWRWELGERLREEGWLGVADTAGGGGAGLWPGAATSCRATWCSCQQPSLLRLAMQRAWRDLATGSMH